MGDYIKALRGGGTFVQLGVPAEAFCIEDITSMFDGNKKIAGSGIGHPHKIKELLELAAEHNIAAQVQVMEMDEVNEAMDITRQNKARFRVVLKN
jgi:D-arabinose 1-dehydrogenase-like Zn-dependent alcohol dehydrogenase